VTKRHTAKKPAHEAPIRPLRSEADYNKALAEIERYFHVEPKPGTSAADRFDLLALVIADYEDKRWPIEPPDPIQAIRWRMETALHADGSGPSDRLAAARVGYSIPQAAPYDGYGMEAPSQVGHSRRSADSSAAEVEAAIHHRGGIARAAWRRAGLV
jgi:hypothetical protein